MKKALLFVVATLGLVACTSEADVFAPAADQSINFKPITQKASRGAFDGSNLPTATAIYVGAYQEVGDTYIQYLKDAEFTCIDPSATVENRRWGADYNYPATGNLHFLAYTCDYGTDKNKPTAVWSGNTAGKYIDGLTLQFGANLKGQTDVTYSDICKAIRKSSGGFDDPALAFHHAQAWVVANFTNTNSNIAAGQMKVRNVKVNNVNVTGNLALTIAADGTITPVWTALDPADDSVEPALAEGAARSFLFPAYKTIGASGKDFVDAVGVENLGILVLPCAEQSISFEYCTANGKNVDDTISYTDWVLYKTEPGASSNTNHKWEAGKKYVYSFSIRSNQIHFSTSVQAFGNNNINSSIE